MEDYIYVSWPDSQDFENYSEEDGIVIGNEVGSILVPKEIYKKVYG